MEHAAEGMVNVEARRCEHPGGCVARPCFGQPGGRAVLCKEHAAEGMVDVVHKLSEAARAAIMER